MKHYDPKEDLSLLTFKKLARLERLLGVVIIGMIFIAMVVFADYLADMGWFGVERQLLSGLR
jgi:hypothetical protein